MTYQRINLRLVPHTNFSCTLGLCRGREQLVLMSSLLVPAAPTYVEVAGGMAWIVKLSHSCLKLVDSLHGVN